VLQGVNRIVRENLCKFVDECAKKSSVSAACGLLGGKARYMDSKKCWYVCRTYGARDVAAPEGDD
jgi:hypothetical protein